MNSQPRHEVFGDRKLGCGPRELSRAARWLSWARFGWLALAGAVMLIGCGRVGDAPSMLDVGCSMFDVQSSSSPQPNIEHPTSNIEHRTEVQLSDEASATGELPVTPVAFAETPEESGAVKSVTFDDIKFEMKKEDKFKQRMLTDKINGLFGKNIRIRGYILPTYKEKGLTRLVLMRDNMECCFGPGAAIYDCIAVDMVEGHTAEFSVRPVTVEGKFTFQKYEDPSDGALRAIYHLDGVSVK